MTAGTPAAMASLKGRRSAACRSAYGRVAAGPKSVLVVEPPRPGKCFTTASTPASARPLANAAPYVLVLVGSALKDRRPSGFLALGLSTIGFAAALDRRFGDTARAPELLGASGVAICLAGLLRRDRMSNWPMPGDPLERQSWVNDAHDIASVAGHACASSGLLSLAARLSREPGLRDLALPAAAAAVAGRFIDVRELMQA